jgi:hypothetical protein
MTFGAQAPLNPAQIMRKTAVTWVSDDTTGAVSGTSTETFSGLFYGITTDPGATAPTDNYDICVTDDTGLELLGGTAGASSTDGNGMNRDTANTEFAQASPYPIPVDGPLTITITGAGNSKVGTIYIWHESR